MKKRWSLILVVCMLASCAGALAAVPVSDPGVLPIVAQPLTLSAWAVQDTIVEDLNTNKTTLWAEQQTGVHIEWIAVGPTEATTQLNLSLASGDYPDMYLYNFTTPVVQMYAKDGVFIPLNDMIDAQGYYTKIVFDEHPEYRGYYTAPDGNIYTSIYTDPGEHLLSQNKMWVNTQWLEAVGLGIPQTTQEFRDMLIAFRDNDVNGNGNANDEIPLVGALGGTNEPVGFLMNPFQLYNEDYLLALDGQITFIANTDGWREGLTYMNGLFKDGLLAEETFVQDLTQLRSLVSIAKPEERLVGTFPAMWQGAAVTIGVLEGGYDLYQPVTPLEGPSGLRQAGTKGFGSLGLRGVITSACDEPMAAFKWMDYWLSEEATVVIDYGFEGSEYEWVDKPAISGVTPSRFRTAIDKWSTVQNDIYSLNVVPHYRTSEILYSRTPTDHVPYLYAGAQAYEPYYVINGFPAFVWASNTDLIAEMTDLATTINDFVKTSYTQFILGVDDITSDAAWQAYVDGLNAMGLERYLEIKQQVTFGE